MSRLAVALLSTTVAVFAFGRELDFGEFRAVQESLARVHPRFRERWLRAHGYEPAEFLPRPWREPESTGLRLVGKWGRGRSVEVTGKDSLVFLSLGSEIAVLNAADPERLQVLTELQLGFCPTQTHVRDSLLVTGGWSCIETWNVSNPAQPVFQARIPEAVGDFCVRDTFLYFVSGGSFRVYSLADPASPYQLGACADSGWATTVAGNTVVLVLHDGFGFMDVSDPGAPRRVGSYGGNSISATARGNICCVSSDEGGSPATASFEVLDITDPAAPRRLGGLSDAGGYDSYLRGSFAFISGWREPDGEFCIIDISDSTRPVTLGRCATPGNEFGIWASSIVPAAFVASDERGLEVIDVTNPALPSLDSSLLRADHAEDIYIVGNRAYVADGRAGLRALDVSDPTLPLELGGLDTLNNDHESVAAKDSFAFMGSMQPPYLRTIDVSDPTNPVMAGGGGAQTVPADMVLRDTLIYLVGRLRFNVVNVARPRQPVLVGSCVTGDLHMAGLWLQGNLAYLAGAYDGIYIVDVTDPRNPAPVRILNGMSAWGCCVVDTFLYVPDFDDSLHIWSIANLFNVYQVGSVHIAGSGYDVKVLGDYAYVGCYGLGVVNVADPRNPIQVDRYRTPQWVRRVVCESGYVYAACMDAGVLVFDTFSTAIAETPVVRSPPCQVSLLGSVVRDAATVVLSGPGGKEVFLETFNITGKRIGKKCVTNVLDGTRHRVDLSRQPAGVYVMLVRIDNRAYQLRVSKL